jgi:hypothetical protein
MAELALFTYGLLTTFILSGASRNRRLRRPDPPAVQYLGYLLCGVSGGLSILLFAYAALALAG